MIGFIVVLSLVLLVEGACIVLHTRAVRVTRVSNNPDTDYSVVPRSKHLSFTLTGITVLALAVVAALQLGPWSLSAVFISYLTARAAMALQEYFNASHSRGLRLSETLVASDMADSRFAFYFSGARALDVYHVTMWLDALKSLGHKFVVVVREKKHLSSIPESDAYQCVTFAGVPATQRLLPASCRAVFYANNSMHNIDVIRSGSSKKHVQLLHGDSDKPPSFNPVSKAYNQLFVAGEMAVDRYAKNQVQISRNRFAIVGRPQLQPIEASKGGTTVVYMTTWSGNFEDSNFSSFNQAIKILKAASQQAGVDEVIFKPHPVSNQDPNWEKVRGQFSELVAKSATPIRWAEHDESPFELYAKADVLISDISSTIIDYLYAGKPYIVTNPQGFSGAVLKNYASVDGGYLCDQDVGNVAELVALALGEDPMAEKREEVRRYAFGDFGRPSGEAFREACWELIGEPAK